MAATARPASTVVLLRPSPSRFDVFLVRRHENVAFMGGAHVFPGGRVDEADKAWGDDRAHHAAAVRELFEEAGVLLARRAGGAMLDFGDAAEAARYHAYRAALAGGRMTLHALAERERLEIAFDQLAWFAHWVTPEVEIKRFDTRFFVAAVPGRQHPAHDDAETTDSAWMDPADAVLRCRRDEIALPPPTWTTLRTLSRFSSVPEVLAWARGCRVVPVQPGFVRNEQVTMLTLPGDPLCPAVDGFETPAETRFILSDGRWRAAVPD